MKGIVMRTCPKKRLVWHIVIGVSCSTVLVSLALGGALMPWHNTAVQASSLWNEGTPSLFEDHKARGVGDLLTVLIVERAYASNKATTTTGKTVGGALADGGGLLSFIPGAGLDARTKFSGANNTTRTGSLVAKMSARVVEVLPNGNLKIQGTQGLIINKEHQDILITGIVRPQDIRSDNTVLSTYVADAQIRYEGRLGSEERKGILGFLQRFFAGVLDILF